MLRVLSLFSGIGGFEIACEMAGMTVVGQVEIDPYCTKVLEKHWPGVKRLENVFDVRGDEFGPVDLIVAGVPCQPASCAGKRRGTEDDRWLWGEALRIVKAVKPTWCLFENPTGILSLQGGLPFENILTDLEAEGYKVQPFIIPASAVGAPHRRERVFIVAYSQELSRNGKRNHGANSKDDGENGIYTQARGGSSNAGARAAGQDVVDTTSRGLPESKHQPRSEVAEQPVAAKRTQFTDTGRGPAQSRVCRVPHEFSPGMDGHWPAGWWPTPRASDGSHGGPNQRDSAGRYALPGAVHQWPSSPGFDQHPYEPPRIAKGVPNRVARLKALGNAVVPAQVLPILKAIAEIAHSQT